MVKFANWKYFFIPICVFVLIIAFAEIALAQHSNTVEQQNPPVLQTAKVDIFSLVEIAVEANPTLIAMRREFDAARARVPQAKALPDPMVSFGNTSVGNPIPFTGISDDFHDFSFGVSQEMPWFGVRRLRGEVANSQAEAKLQEYQLVLRQLTSEVKIAAYELYNFEHALYVINRDLEVLKRFAKVAEARYSVGKAQQIDVINAQVEITELLDKQGELEAKRAIAVAHINHLLYRDPDALMEPLAEIHMSPMPASLEELIPLALENSPELQQHKRNIDSNNHSLRLAEREAKYPEVGFSFTYHKRISFPDYYTYGITFKLPLYAFNKQRYAIAEQSANLAASRSRLAATSSMIRFKVKDGLVRARAAQRLIKLHEEGILPQATLALESAIAGYEVGQVDFLTLLTTLKRALDYETRYYQLLTDYQKALAEMEVYVGVELTK